MSKLSSPCFCSGTQKNREQRKIKKAERKYAQLCEAQLCVFTLFCAISLGISAPQTKPWRIAISGGQAVTALGGNVPGYLSILALHGLPRMRLDKSELTNLERLRQFDVVIAC